MRCKLISRSVRTLTIATTLLATLLASAGPEAAQTIEFSPDNPTATSAGDGNGDESLQFTSAGHILRFDVQNVIVASGTYMVRTEFVGANPAVPVSNGGGSLPAEPFRRVIYQNLWDGVDVVYEPTDDGIAKSTYLLDNAGLANSIHLRYNRQVSLDTEGNLKFQLATGVMMESAPIAWQDIDGVQQPVDVSFVILGQNEVGFRLGQCVPGRQVVIDPWVTFMGASSIMGEDKHFGIAVDSSGNVYVAGHSDATWGSPVRAYDRLNDAFAAKLDSEGELQWNTFLGGFGQDYAEAIAVDGDGNVYIAGHSLFTWGSPVRDYGGQSDAFAAKLNSSGALQWNTFLGSVPDHDYGKAVDVDGDGNVYVAGDSYATWESPERAHQGGRDAFAAKLNNSGALQWNTFLGSSNFDQGLGVAVDSTGNVYVAGDSMATWQGTSDPVRAYTSTGDAFAAKLDNSGSLQWNTFLGGTAGDYGGGITLYDGAVYVCGTSRATWKEDNDPVRAHTALGDIFAARLNTSGTLQWNTFLGGTDEDYGYCIATDGDGNVCVTGHSDASWGNPVRQFQAARDASAVKLGDDGTMAWNTFLGGNNDDEGRAVAVDGEGNVCVAGFSKATWEDPIRPFQGGCDGFTAKMTSGGAFTVDIDLVLKTGWNMVSVPVQASDMSTSTIFPGVDAVYTWDPSSKSYTMPTTIEPEKGYWVAVSSDRTITVTGTPVIEWEDGLLQGWNMIGSVYGGTIDFSDPDDDPNGSCEGFCYCWNPSGKCYDYETDICTGVGYWAACTSACDLTMGPAGP